MVDTSSFSPLERSEQKGTIRGQDREKRHSTRQTTARRPIMMNRFYPCRRMGELCVMSIQISTLSFCRAFKLSGSLSSLHFRNHPTVVPYTGTLAFLSRQCSTVTMPRNRLQCRKLSAGKIDNEEIIDEPIRNFATRAPRALTDLEWQAAQSFITPELKAKFTLSDGSIDYKSMSKLIPLQSDSGPLDVVYEDNDLIAVRPVILSTVSARIDGCRQVSKPSGMLMNPPHRSLSTTAICACDSARK